MHCNIEFMKQVLPIFLSPGGGPLFFYDSIEVDVRLLPKLNASFIEECCLRLLLNISSSSGFLNYLELLYKSPKLFVIFRSSLILNYAPLPMDELPLLGNKLDNPV